MNTANPRGLAPTMIAVALLYSGHPLAQTGNTTQTPQAPQLPRYFVEVLVFSNEAGTAGSSESFEPRPDPFTTEPGTANASREALPANVFTDEQTRLDAAVPVTSVTEPGDEAMGDGDADGALAAEAPDEFRFELIDAANLKLTSEWAALQRLSAYKPIFHGGWIQEGYPEDRARPFDLSIIDSMAPLAGTVTFYRSRFLHVRVALQYLPESARQPGNTRNSLAPVYALTAPARRYEINEARRLRSGELHYLDHPAFGVLILITPEPEREILELEIQSLPTPLPGPTTDEPQGR